jgi:DNA-binding IclR family transcriptional regulator
LELDSGSIMSLKTPSVPGLERGLAVLELVAASRSGLTFSQIAQAVPFPNSSVHCLLLTLVRLGYLQRIQASGRYLCTTRVINLADTAMPGIALHQTAAPLLFRVAQQSGLTSHLAILEKGEAMLVGKVESHRPPITTWAGKRIGVHCTSLGKCLIAWLPEDQLQMVIRERGLMRYNENTICSVAKLERELQSVRELGYAVDDEEEEIGVRCVGVPAFSSEGKVIAAISVSGRVDSLDRNRFGELAELLREIAADASESLAGVLGPSDTAHPNV